MTIAQIRLYLEPERALHGYSLCVVAFDWKHSAGSLSQSDLVGPGGDGRSCGGLELPPTHR